MKPYYADESVTLYHGDALTVLSGMPDASINCCVTSPPNCRCIAPRINEWSVMDSGDPTVNMCNIGIILPYVKAVELCLRRNRHGLICLRPQGHGGRHAATVLEGHVTAVWS